MTPDEDPGTHGFRIRHLEERTERLWDRKADKETVEQLREEMASVRRALYTLAGGVVIGAFTFALAVFQLTAGG